MQMCVKYKDFSSVSTIYDFGNIRTFWYFFVFHFMFKFELPLFRTLVVFTKLHVCIYVFVLPVNKAKLK